VNKQLTPFDMAIAAVGGTQRELAKRLGCTEQNISKLKKKGCIPTNNPELWVKATGLPKQKLFPQFYQ
jgi:transcriptional regulator with XRE-family HTH domain